MMSMVNVDVAYALYQICNLKSSLKSHFHLLGTTVAYLFTFLFSDAPLSFRRAMASTRQGRCLYFMTILILFTVMLIDEK